MGVINIHTRELRCSPQRAAELIDSLASPQDLLWPRDAWPAMRFDRPLGVGAVGGHGPIRYTVEQYEAGRWVRFRFTAPTGFDGYHALELTTTDAGVGQQLRHVLEMNARGVGALQWAVIYRWLHDALVENALDRAERHASGEQVRTPWSLWVRVLRKALGVVRGGRVGSANRPHN